MTKRLKRNIELLKILKKCKNRRQRQVILELANNDLVHCVCDCINNILKGNLQLSKKKREELKKFAPVFRQLAESKGGVETKRKVLIQKGGFLPALLAPIIGLAGGLIGELVGSLIKK